MLLRPAEVWFGQGVPAVGVALENTGRLWGRALHLTCPPAAGTDLAHSSWLDQELVRPEGVTHHSAAATVTSSQAGADIRKDNHCGHAGRSV